LEQYIAQGLTIPKPSEKCGIQMGQEGLRTMLAQGEIWKLQQEITGLQEINSELEGVLNNLRDSEERHNGEG